MGALLGLVGGGTNALAILGVIVSLGGGAMAYWHEHDARLVSEIAAKQAVVSAQAQHDQDQRTITGLSTEATLAVARAAGTARIKEAIHAAPKTNACASSPAIRALVTGLRGGPGGGNTEPAPTAAGLSMVLPASATAAR